MANSDFQQRLDRIQANRGAGLPDQGAAPGVPSGRGKPSPAQFILGCVLISLGTTLLRKTNEHYEAIRDGQGLGAAVALAILGVALLLFGCRSVWRWAKGREVARPSAPIASTSVQTSARAKATASLCGWAKGREVARPSAPIASTSVQTSARAKATASLCGLALGVIASLLMFLASAYHFADAEKWAGLANLLTLAALALAAVALLIGATGLIVRGRALLRVPACFFISGLLTFAVVRAFRIDILTWRAYLPQGL